MVRVIAIEREYGSGAASISGALAAELGWTHWDREISAEIARHLHCGVEEVEDVGQRPDPVFYRLLRAFMRGSFESSLEGSQLEMLDAERVAMLFEKVIKDIASRGNCVIVGRGAAYFLRDRPDSYSAFLYAPYEEKVRRTIAQGKSRSEAETLIETVDRERAAFVKKYYGKDWPDRHLYNLMINTKVGDAIAVKTILDQVETLNIRERTARTG